MHNLASLVYDDFYKHSGALQLTQSYDTFTTTISQTAASSLLSRFDVDLTAVLTTYYQVLLDLSARADLAYRVLTNTSSADAALNGTAVTWNTSLHDVTTYNPAVPAYNPSAATPGDPTRQVYETDYLDPAAREDFFKRSLVGGDLRLDWRNFSALLGMPNLMNNSALVYNSLFFVADQFSTSIPARNVWPAGANASLWRPFRPHFRDYNIEAITGPKLVSIIIALSNDLEVSLLFTELATVLINALSSADRAIVIIDDGKYRYPYTCGNSSTFTLVRAKPEIKPALIDFLTDFRAVANASTIDAFNITFDAQEKFGAACTTPSSQITIFYMRSTASHVPIPKAGAVSDIWENRPLINRLMVINYVKDSHLAAMQNLSLVDLACRNSGIYVKAHVSEDPEQLFEVTYQTLLFMNAELQPSSALITVEKGWRQDSPVMYEGLLWTLTVPIYLELAADLSAVNQTQIANPKTLLGLAGIDFPPKVFADTLFRSVRWGLYAFVVDRQLDVLLHMGMDFFDWTVQHAAVPEPPFTSPISRYETILAQSNGFEFYYPMPTHIKTLQNLMSRDYFGHQYIPSIHRGYSWTTMPFFNLVAVLVFRQDVPQESPVLRFQNLFPSNSLCSSPDPTHHFAVPFWDPASPEYPLAVAHKVPESSPLAVHQFRQDINGTTLPQRTWNISTGFFEVFGFSAPWPIPPFDLGRLSLKMQSQDDVALVQDPSYLPTAAWIHQLNDFLSCRSILNPSFTPSVVADVEATSFLYDYWSGSWLNASASGELLPFMQAVWTQNGLYRFWPDNDGVSLADHWVYNVLDIAILDDVEIISLPFQKNGPSIVNLVFPVRSALSADLTAPTALTVTSFEYLPFTEYIFSTTFPACTAGGNTRCYLVDDLLQVVLATADIEKYCSPQFGFELGKRSIVSVEQSLVLDMWQRELVFLDGTSITYLRVQPDNIPSTSVPAFSFGFDSLTNCSFGQYYIWKLPTLRYYMIAVINSNMDTQQLCESCPLLQNASDPIVTHDYIELLSICYQVIDSDISIVCPSTDRAQQLLESLRPDEYKCFAGYDLQDLQFTDTVAIILYCVYAMLSILVLLLTILFIKHRHTSVIESSNVIFVFTTLSGTLFASVSVFFWIGQPNNSICIARMWFSVCGFALISGMLFAKILFVYLNIDDPKVLRIKMPDHLLVAFSSMAIAPQVLIVLIWTAYDPLIPNLSIADPNFSTLEQRPAQWLCSSDTSLGFYLSIYILQGILIVAGAILTLTTRKTKSIWNESTWIGLVVYISAIIYPTVILLRQLLNGTPTQEFLILFIGVFIGVICLIGFVFCTKAWVIFFQQSMNDTEAQINAEINENFQPNLDD